MNYNIYISDVEIKMIGQIRDQLKRLGDRAEADMLDRLIIRWEVSKDESKNKAEYFEGQE